MSGIEPSPIAVGAHVDTTTGTPTGVRARANLEARTMPLIAAPGITTDANVCHMSVSMVATTETSGAFDDLCSIAPPYDIRPEFTASASTYPEATT